jgi:hypothetical protein
MFLEAPRMNTVQTFSDIRMSVRREVFYVGAHSLEADNILVVAQDYYSSRLQFARCERQRIC